MPTFFEYKVQYTLICDDQKKSVTKLELRKDMVKDISDFDYEEEMCSTYGCNSIKLEYIAVAFLFLQQKKVNDVEKEDFCIIM